MYSDIKDSIKARLYNMKFGETYERYYYIFEDEELYNLFWKSGWKLGSHVWDHGNEIFTVIAR